jgi:hypothetical protein
MSRAARMSDEDFITWLEVKAHKYVSKYGAWHDCIESLIKEFKSEWEPRE